jgi:CheY-like chemotaxis protein
VPTLRFLKIVLAEDNPHDVLLVRKALTDAGMNFDLRVLADGEQAVRFIDCLDEDPGAPTIDLFLLDVNLPKRDGEEILKRLRTTRRCAETPVILMTGSYAPQVRENAQKDEAAYYFRKPSTLAEYMNLGNVARHVLTSRKSIGNEMPDLPLKEGSGS